MNGFERLACYIAWFLTLLISYVLAAIFKVGIVEILLGDILLFVIFILMEVRING